MEKLKRNFPLSLQRLSRDYGDAEVNVPSNIIMREEIEGRRGDG